MNDPRIIVALDYPDARGALALAERLDPGSCRLKIGKELYTAAGPALVEKLAQAGFGLFLDLKYHDIPNTVRSAAREAAHLGVAMLTVHALGGPKMMEAARAGAEDGCGRPSDRGSDKRKPSKLDNRVCRKPIQKEGFHG